MQSFSVLPWERHSQHPPRSFQIAICGCHPSLNHLTLTRRIWICHLFNCFSIIHRQQPIIIWSLQLPQTKLIYLNINASRHCYVYSSFTSEISGADDWSELKSLSFTSIQYSRNHLSNTSLPWVVQPFSYAQNLSSSQCSVKMILLFWNNV